MLMGQDPSCRMLTHASEVVWTALLSLCVHFLAL